MITDFLDRRTRDLFDRKSVKGLFTMPRARTARHRPVHPGEILSEEFLLPLGITKYRLAKDTGMPADRVGRLVRGTRNVTADTALRLAAYFKTTAEFWMNLQARYDLEVARDSGDVTGIAKIEPFKAA